MLPVSSELARPDTRRLRVLLVNPPIESVVADIGVGHQMPLGLLMIGGPLLDAGHEVRLLDAARQDLDPDEVARRADLIRPDVVMAAHVGATMAHPSTLATFAALRAALPDAVLVYGGVHATYHHEAILREHPAVDVVVRGEGEATDARARGDAGRRRRSRDRSGDRVPPAGRRRGPDRRAPADRGPRRVAHRLGAHRGLGPVSGLRARPRCGRAVLARLSPHLHLLRPVDVLEAMAAPRRHSVRGRAGVAPPRARRALLLAGRREPHHDPGDVGGVPRRDRAARSGHRDVRLDPRQRHRARCGHPRPLRAGRLPVCPDGRRDRDRRDARPDPQGLDGRRRVPGRPPPPAPRDPVDRGLHLRPRGRVGPHGLARASRPGAVRRRLRERAVRHAPHVDPAGPCDARRPARGDGRGPLGLSAPGRGHAAPDQGPAVLAGEGGRGRVPPPASGAAPAGPDPEPGPPAADPVVVRPDHARVLGRDRGVPAGPGGATLDGRTTVAEDRADRPG